MSRIPAPLRFLAGICLGWICVRAGIIWLAPWDAGAATRDVTVAATAPSVPAMSRVSAASVPLVSPDAPADRVPWTLGHRSLADSTPVLTGPAPPPAATARAWTANSIHSAAGVPRVARKAVEPPPSPELSPSFIPPAAPSTGRRWSLSAWAFVRGGGAAPLAPGGTLGGSQAGVRGTYRILGTRAPLALSLRMSTPLEQARGAEAAVGLDWKPLRGAPVHLLAERRQRLGRDGRSAFGLTAYGGIDDARLGPLRLDAYGQAGVLGLKRRDLFADGAVRAALPVDRGGRFRLGAGAWGAAQPGVARVDVGPHAELRLPLGPTAASLSADWRFRIGGNARPGSGPALILAAGF
jgi:hypothetical protein